MSNLIIQKPSGIILIDKPKNLTSHDVVDRLRTITGIQKIGHAGTLDPFATGLLILLIGKEATKCQSFFLHQNKEYWVKIRLGAISDTHDLTGQIEEKHVEKKPELAKIKEIENEFLGEQWQKPPLFSAKKIKGKKAYQLARQGKEVKIEPQRIKIYSLNILAYAWPFLEIRVVVSSGTYLRSLANDIGKFLQTGGLAQELKREKIGQISLNQAVTLNRLDLKNWINYLIPLNKFL